jgi:hypothetical protein
MPAVDGLEPGPGTTPTPVANGPGTDPLPAIAIQTLSQAVEMLRDDVELSGKSRSSANRSRKDASVSMGC